MTQRNAIAPPRRARRTRLALLSALLFAALAARGFAQNTEPKAPAGGSGPGATAPSASATGALAGVLVIAVQADSPAAKAGVARGDIILEADGKTVNDAADLRQAVAGHSSGDTLSVRLRHGDAEKTLAITIGAREGRPWIGILALPGRGPGAFAFDGEHDGMMFPAEGALVESVTAGGPAEKAGLKKGDLILSVDGTTVDERNALSDLVSSKKVGDTITLSVASGGQPSPRDVKVTLGKSPARDAPFLGVQYLPAPERFGHGEDGTPGGTPGGMPGGMIPAAIVVGVMADGPAAKAGLKAHDLVVKVEGAPVSNPQQVVDAVAKHKPGDTLALTVFRLREGKQTEIIVTLGQSPNDAAKAWLGVEMRGLVPGMPPGMRGQQNTPPSAAGANAPTL